MKRFIEHIKDTHTTHERRQRAMQVAGALTATLFAVWLGTLSLRLTSQDEIAQTTNSVQTASVAASVQNNDPQLQVSTTSIFQ